MRQGRYFSGVTPALARTALLCLFAVPGVAATEPSASSPILGVDPLARGTAMENHPDALAHWVERGHAGVVLLHIAANHGLRTIKAEKLAELKGLAGRGDLPALLRAGRGGTEGLFDEGNFVRVAAHLGIIREVVWIAPFPIEVDEDATKRLKDYLGRIGFTAKESGSFRPEKGCYRGRVGAIPVRLCGQERLPAIDDPVVLSIGADFFPYAAGARGSTIPTEIRALFASLRGARYAVLDALLAYSVREGGLAPDQRWIGQAVLEVLKDPSVVLGEKPPRRWGVMQKLATLGGSGQQGEVEMLGVALSELEQQPHDPALLLYAAEAAANHSGGGERALAYAEEACRMDRGLCVGVREVGLRFLERGEIEIGLRFFAVGEKLSPGMAYGQLDLGIALMKAGRTTDALAALEKLRARDGDFPGSFLIGATHLFKGDRAAARLSFDAALAALERAGEIQVVRGEIAHVIATAAAYYREEGLKKQAKRLEGDPRLRLPAPDAGR